MADTPRPSPTPNPSPSPSPAPSSRYASDGSGHKNDLSHYRVPGRHDSADSTWSYEAGKEYRVHTDQLEKIADNMVQELDHLQKALNDVASMSPITVQHVGITTTGQRFAEMAYQAHNGFSQYYAELQQGYRSVISRLYKSAGNYKKAEEYSTSGVLSTETGSRSSSSGPTTGSTGPWAP